MFETWFRFFVEFDCFNYSLTTFDNFNCSRRCVYERESFLYREKMKRYLN